MNLKSRSILPETPYTPENVNTQHRLNKIYYFRLGPIYDFSTRPKKKNAYFLLACKVIEHFVIYIFIVLSKSNHVLEIEQCQMRFYLSNCVLIVKVRVSRKKVHYNFL